MIQICIRWTCAFNMFDGVHRRSVLGRFPAPRVRTAASPRILRRHGADPVWTLVAVHYPILSMHVADGIRGVIPHIHLTKHWTRSRHAVPLHIPYRKQILHLAGAADYCADHLDPQNCTAVLGGYCSRCVYPIRPDLRLVLFVRSNRTPRGWTKHPTGQL